MYYLLTIYIFLVSFPIITPGFLTIPIDPHTGQLIIDPSTWTSGTGNPNPDVVMPVNPNQEFFWNGCPVDVNGDGNNNIDNWVGRPLDLDCSKFKRDLDVLRSFSYPIQLNPLITTGKTYAIMNSASQVEELSIYNEINLPIDVFCLIHLRTLRVNGTPFAPHNQFDVVASDFIYNLKQLRVLSLINITASFYIFSAALTALTNLTILEIDNCGLCEIPISLFTNLQQLRLPNNRFHSIPHTTGNFSKSFINNSVFSF